MFETLKEQPADSLLALIKAFQDDPRAHKIDLGVGVYRDENGVTPVMRAVKQAERILWETQESKRYLGPEGDMTYVELLKPYVFGASAKLGERLTGIQTPGGTGALRLGAELIHAASPEARIYVGTPTWPNHSADPRPPRVCRSSATPTSISRRSASISRRRRARCRARGPAMSLCCTAAATIPPVSISRRAQWREIARIVAERKLIPFIDLAYQGLGDGLDEDAASTRLLLESVDEALVAYSCDKNFGLYRDRVGALYTLARDVGEARKTASNFTYLARVNWSMPPDHGAALVRIILESPSLTAHVAKGTRFYARAHQVEPRGAGGGASETGVHPRRARPVFQPRI